MYTMSLRAPKQSDQDNVDEVFGRLPNCTHNDHCIDAFYDRGYGKKKTIKTTAGKGYRLHTVAASVGPRHPWLTTDEVNKKIR